MGQADDAKRKRKRKGKIAEEESAPGDGNDDVPNYTTDESGTGETMVSPPPVKTLESDALAGSQTKIEDVEKVERLIEDALEVTELAAETPGSVTPAETSEVAASPTEPLNEQ